MEEKEIKIMLTSDQYEALLSAARERSGEMAAQTNYYFDTGDFTLYHHNMMMRIREKNASYRITLKTGAEKSDMGLRCQELEFEIDEAKALSYLREQRIYLPGIEKIKNAFNALNSISCPEWAELKGHMVTCRMKFPLPDTGLKLELDKSDYLGMTDYEIECEYENDEDTGTILAYLKQFGIAGGSNMKTKYDRFIAGLNKK